MQIELGKSAFIASIFIRVFALIGAGNLLAAPPTIGTIPDQTVIEDQPTHAFQMTLNDPDGTLDANMQLSGFSSDQTVVPDTNIFFGLAAGHRYITVTPAFGKTGSVTVKVIVTDNQLEKATNTFNVTVNPPPPGWGRFANLQLITIPSNGVATPYPATNLVSGMIGTITNMTVTLSKLSHDRVQEVSMLLVSPTGQGSVIFSHVSGNNRSATNVTVCLTDSSTYSLPLDFMLWSEPLQPTAYPPAVTFPAPAPTGTFTGQPFTIFNGLSANGTWSLYVYDEQATNKGVIAGGWSLTITTVSSGPQPPTISDIGDQSIGINTNTGPIPFTIGDADTPVNSLTLGRNSSNTNLVPTNNIVFGGSGSNRTVTVTPAAGQTGTSTITVTVSDGANAANDTFLLTVNGVNTPPTISTITNQTINEDTSTVPINFIIGDAETVAGSLTLGRASSNPTLIPTNNIVFGGSGSNCTVTVTPAADQNGVATITVSVSDGQLSASTNFTVTVNAVNDAPTISSIGNQTISVNGTTGPLNFTIGDAETAAASLTLGRDSSNTTLVPTNNIVFGGSNSNRTVTVTPAAGQTGTATITVSVSDGQLSASNSFVLTVSTLVTGTVSFTNTAAITIPSVGNATPYPSTNTVTGMAGIITNVTVTLRNMNHTYPADVDVLLVGPGGQKAMIFSDVGGGNDITNVTLTLSDAAATSLTATGQIVSGTNKPTDVEPGEQGELDTFSAPAPAGPYTSVLSVFNGQSPNGNWLLYVTDDGPGDQGAIASGWSIRITTVGGTPQAPIVTWTNPAAVTYGTALSGTQLNASANTAGSFVYSPAAGTVLNAGSNQVLSVIFTPTDTQNYTSATNAVLINVQKASLSITANDTNKVYGAALPSFTASYSGFVNGDTTNNLLTAVSLGTTATASSPVASYPITASGATSTNYTIAFVPGTLTVTKSSLTVTGNDTNKVYGAALPVFTASYSGFVNGDTTNNLLTPVSLGTTATPASPAGSYPITASGVTSTNYTITFVPGTLTVTKSPLTVTGNDTNKVYGAALPSFTANYSGFVNGDTTNNLLTPVSLQTTATPASPTGVYPIIASGATSTNYTITFAPGTLTVTEAALTITADDTNKVYAAALPSLTASYSGFVNGDTTNNLLTPVSLGTAATPASPAGNYPITASGATSTNYTINFIPGTLTVAKAPLTITAEDKSRFTGQTNPLFTAIYDGFVNGDTSSSLDVPVSLTTTASVSSVAGTYPIVAGGAADVDYNITFTNGTLTVTDPPPPLISGIIIDDQGVIHLTVIGEIGIQYGLESSGDLANWNQMDVQTNMTGSIEFVEQPMTNEMQFFRALSMPPAE